MAISSRTGAIKGSAGRFKGFWMFAKLPYNWKPAGLPMTEPVYDLFLPDVQGCPVVLASPHSGRAYGPGFLGRSVLDPLRLRSSEDAFVDRLFAGGPDLGLPLLAARVPRSFVDFNRGADELDPQLIDGLVRRNVNARVAAGLGVIPRVVAAGRPIYAGKLPMAEAEERLKTAWVPYHETLDGLLRRTLARFGVVLLLDCHSMPREALDSSLRGARRPHVVLGDRFGAAAAPEIVALVEGALRASGLRVARNTPFAGAHVAEHYGRPRLGCHVVQLELDRSLYMDERRLVPTSGFSPLRECLDAALARIAAGWAMPSGSQLAAE